MVGGGGYSYRGNIHMGVMLNALNKGIEIFYEFGGAICLFQNDFF